MELVSIELTKVYRQTDQVFVSVLDHIRTNTAGNADLQLLNTRYTPTPPCRKRMICTSRWPPGGTM